VLIRDAEIWGHGVADVRIITGAIAQIGTLTPRSGEPLIMARGGALLPGLHDHHIHLAALAAQRASVACGPPAVYGSHDLERAMRDAPGDGWIRGVGYHESVLGSLPDHLALDRIVPDRPLRMQHRSGRMWLLNTRALDVLTSHMQGAPPAGLQRDAQGYTGHLFDEDAWLQRTLGSAPPDFAEVSADLARCGVTGVTDMSPRNDGVMARHFAQQREGGVLRQHVVLAGTLALAGEMPRSWTLGPAKLHLHEAALPDFDDAVAFARAAHRQSRQVAVHCVSEVELVFALAVLEQAGDCAGDRIEHASVAPPELLDEMAHLDLHACVQPCFVHERGDRYLADVEPRHHADLYRLDTIARRGIPLAGGSDAPYGSVDPWTAMRAAVSRRTSGGVIVGAGEALSPEAALALYLVDPLDFTRQRAIAVGAPADLCLLERPWHAARERLSSGDVVATFVNGAIVHQRGDQSPGERLSRADSLA
jgi:predicted amidohydrolase YtcJ